MPIRFLCLIFICLCLSFSARAATFTPDGDVIGKVSRYTVKKKDNLYDIARQFDLGIVEVLAANPGVTQKNLKAGATLTLPTAHILPPVHEGVVLNLSELRLFYFAPDGHVMTFPIGIGREGWQTPLGETEITLRREHPAWIPTDSIREEDPDLPDIVPPGPDNPLGAFALNLGWPGYAIHGTNRPHSIGKRASHGCIRLYPEDIEVLFNAAQVGTPVTVIDAPYKLGWRGDMLWLEVTPTQAQTDAIIAYHRLEPVSLPEIDDAIRSVAGNMDIDWHVVDTVVARRGGIPTVVGEKPSR